MTEVAKKSLTRALLAAIEHRDLQPWLSKPREAEEVAAPATSQGGKHRGDRRGLQLVCACNVHTLNSCHGDVIVDWVRGRLRPD